ncbi:MAG: glycosyltransferase [Ferruginibacter sp.]
MEDYYKTAYQKNALLSYIIYPFVGPILNNHSNHRECLAIAEILKELGYNVDVINWDNNTFIPKKKYDVVIDNHNNLARLSSHLKEARKIFHASNAHWLYQNWVEYGRCYQFYVQYGKALVPPRLMPPGNSAEYCDAISMFGNEFTKTTFGGFSKKITQLPMSVVTEVNLLPREYLSTRHNFLWINSHGALLKGLDIIIDAFSQLPDFKIFICTDTSRDLDFFESRKQQFKDSPNICLIGWVDTGGITYNNLLQECAWIIGSSFCEGGGGSVLNGMASGLVPLVSRSMSITLPIDTGFYMEHLDVASMVQDLKEIVLTSEIQYKTISQNAYNFIKNSHTVQNFKQHYKEFLINEGILA